MVHKLEVGARQNASNGSGESRSPSVGNANQVNSDLQGGSSEEVVCMECHYRRLRRDHIPLRRFNRRIAAYLEAPTPRRQVTRAASAPPPSRWSDEETFARGYPRRAVTAQPESTRQSTFIDEPVTGVQVHSVPHAPAASIERPFYGVSSSLGSNSYGEFMRFGGPGGFGFGDPGDKLGWLGLGGYEICEFGPGSFDVKKFRETEAEILKLIAARFEAMITHHGMLATSSEPRIDNEEPIDLSNACNMYYFSSRRLPHILDVIARMGKIVLMAFQELKFMGLQFLHLTREARLLIAGYAKAVTIMVKSSENMILEDLGIPDVDFIQVGHSICASLVDVGELVLCPHVAPPIGRSPVFRMAQVSRQAQFDELMGSIRHSVKISLLGELLISS